MRTYTFEAPTGASVQFTAERASARLILLALGGCWAGKQVRLSCGDPLVPFRGVGAGEAYHAAVDALTRG